MPGVPRAERTVAQYATWSSASVTIGAAWTALTGFHRNGSSGVISGIDQCGVEPEVAGMATASPPGYTQSGGGRSHLRGSPPLRSLGSYDEAAASIPWDWADIVEGGALLPDITIPGDRWPDSFSSEDWPIILVNGDLSLPSSGHGLLVVTGSLRMNGRVDWAGLVLVGDRVTGNGNNGIQGAVFSGLNVLLGEPSILGPTIGTNSVGNGTKRIHYNSCAISLALEGLGGLVAIPNTWSDNWAMY
jgi:hypothetical protein